MKSTIISKMYKILTVALIAAFTNVAGIASLSAQEAALETEKVLEKGDLFPEINSQDQHGKSFELPSDEREISFVLVSFDMATGKRANGELADLGSEFLPENDAVFMANIYGMPAIGRFFAFRKMKKYPHEIIFADKEGLLDNFPKEEAKVTVFSLDKTTREIQSIAFWDPGKQDLKQLLQAK